MNSGVVAFIVSLLLLVGLGFAEQSSILEPERSSCQDFCSLQGLSFHSVQAGSCICEQLQNSIDLQNNAQITWSTLVPVGNVRNLEVISPIPQETIAAIQQQLVQQGQ